MRLPPDRLVIRELFETIILGLLIFLLVNGSVRNYKVEGPSMKPTLNEGQFILVNKLVYLQVNPRDLMSYIPFFGESDKSTHPPGFFVFHPPQKGEVVIFRSPENLDRDFVKRIVATEGDSIRIIRGQVIINGDTINDPYASPKDQSDHPTTIVPKDSYFVLGDNRKSSSDSRDWGTINNHHIIGRAWITLWPIDLSFVLSAISNLP